MTKQEFDNYKFSVVTQVEFRGEWYNITEVNFGDRYIGLSNGYYLSYGDKDITGIRG